MIEPIRINERWHMSPKNLKDISICEVILKAREQTLRNAEQYAKKTQYTKLHNIDTRRKVY